MSKIPSIPDPGNTDAGQAATIRALRQAVNLISGAVGDSSTTAATQDHVTKSAAAIINKVVRPDLQTLDSAITEANAARAAAFAELDKALSDLADGKTSSTLQGQINDIGVQTDNAQADIIDERVARIDGDDALAGRIDAITATVGQNTASIINESVVRAQADNSIAASVSTLSSTTNRAVSFVQSFPPPPSSTLKVGDLWVDTSQGNSLNRWSGAQWLPIDNNAIAQNAAAIVNEQTARTTAVSALANTVSTLTTTVGDNTASIGVQQSSLNGVLVQYTITGNIDGSTGKFSFGGVQKADGSVAFGVEIDGSLTVNGSITGDKVAANQINANHIQAQSIDAVRMVTGTVTSDSGVIGALGVKSLSIGDNAVIIPVYKNSFVQISGAGGLLEVLRVTVDVDTTGLTNKKQSLLCTFNAALGFSTGSATVGELHAYQGAGDSLLQRINTGGTVLGSLDMSGVYEWFASGGVDSITVIAYWAGSNSASMAGRTLMVLGSKGR